MKSRHRLGFLPGRSVSAFLTASPVTSLPRIILPVRRSVAPKGPKSLVSCLTANKSPQDISLLLFQYEFYLKSGFPNDKRNQNVLNFSSRTALTFLIPRRRDFKIYFRKLIPAAIKIKTWQSRMLPPRKYYFLYSDHPLYIL